MNEQEANLIRGLVQSPAWGAIEHLATEYCAKVRENSPVRDTQWDTVKETIIQEGKVSGVRGLIQEIHNQANR